MLFSQYCTRMMERLVESCRDAKNALVNTDISWRTYGLIACFALSSWITVNGIWSELPVIVLYAPEKWKIASYTVVIIQLGFAGPLLFSLANRLRPRVFTEKVTIYLIFLIGILSCLFLSMWYRTTTNIDGKPHSVVLMVLVFTMALVDCTSSVVFLTFMAFYDPRYVTALYIGESFCGLLPGLAAIIQGSPTIVCNNSSDATSGNSTSQQYDDSGLLFSASAYFIILLVMILFSGSAFFALNFLPFAVKEQSAEVITAAVVPQHCNDATDRTELINEELETEVKCGSSCLSNRGLSFLFFLQAIVSAFSFGILPSLSPYAFEPYGMPSYHLVASLGPIASSFICFFTIWFRIKSRKTLLIASFVFLCAAVYQVILASQSPTPWLSKSDTGATLAVIGGLTTSMLGIYIRLTISIIMREESKRALYWCGMSIQIGSVIGAFTIFPFVSVFHDFHGKDVC
ncbi:riboflavin transporter 2-like [Dendronephthya gigantea]|uniref:riboflavin transporter 2-like n=1 Tax=Dendronephthya gigantea TaxID=151771 RepID=UPI00106D5B4B|nr:riboflavin transporter 2-like [Dendronephthya gigantea]